MTRMKTNITSLPKQNSGNEWGQLRQYEDQVNKMVMERGVEEAIEDVTVKTRVKKFKASSSRTFVNLKNQVSGIYR